MAVTSLIKPIQNKSGIFYTFQSALEDINITLANTENGVRFSKYALLRIPEFGTPNTLETDNKFQFLAQGETSIIEGLNSDYNINLAQSFQNYALNLEALLISRSAYNREEKLTVSERVFWKWLKESGSIRFRDANIVEKNIDKLGSEPRFVEDSTPMGTYNSVVKYLGDIDVVNSIKSKNNSYTELYIHIPTNTGTTPHVLFKSVKDSNYYPNMTITNKPSDPLDIEYLSGRHYDDVHPFGLSLKAYYDLDDSSVTTEISDTYNGDYTTSNWYNHTINNSYYTDNVNGEFNVATTEWIRKTIGVNSIDYARTRLDGISLDFDLANYKLAAENSEIQSFSQFNDYVGNKNFEFNAILIYYDTYDPNNLDDEGNPVDFERNLYGILFLDKVEQDGLEFNIPFITKYMPDPLNKTNGNSFSFKPNLKLDTSIEDVLVEKSINDFTTFSMDLFLDVLTEFRQIQAQMNDKLVELEGLKQEVEEVKNLLLDTEDKNEFDIRLSNIETSLIENSAIFNNTGELTRMIENNSDKINSIINGNTNITISFDSNILKPGDGIKLDRKTPNRVKIENLNQEYNISNNSITNIFDNNVITLGKFNNYVRHENTGETITLSRDLEIFLNDTDTTWKKGQSLKLVINDPIDLDVYDIKIKTDALNLLGAGSYAKTIAVLNNDDFGTDKTPIFEIICINSETLEFKIDKIR